MFEKREQRVFANADLSVMYAKSMEFWRAQGFNLMEFGNSTFAGEHFTSKLGLKRKVQIQLLKPGENVLVDATFCAEITETGAVAGAIGAVLLFPVAVAVGAVSYFEYENDADNLMRAFWQYLYLIAASPDKNILPPVLPTPEQQMATTASITSSQSQQVYCKHCGAKIETDSKFCRYCGGKQ
ncbi:MAG: zinc ribbon domain-containing protein [Thermoplasmata archaeon]|nr:zinc ribbon domain-containing protein [Thermoplasmata archaeon]